MTTATPGATRVPETGVPETGVPETGAPETGAPENGPLDDGALDRIFRSARTQNSYLDRPVEPELLRAIWDLMKWGPTSANALPARLVWCASDPARDRLAALASAGNAPKIRAAPVAVVIGMDLDFYKLLPELYPAADAMSWFAGDDAKIRETAFRNSSLQGAYFIIAARALGLDVGPMSGFDNAGVDAEFFAGSSVKSNFIATLGYGDPQGVYPRGPRPAFERFNRIV